MGIVPCGSGNDYAYETLKLPRDPAAALEIALHGEPVAMDVGRVNGRYFLNSLGVGIDANIAAAAEELKGKPFMRGQMLYWGASLREILFHYDRVPRVSPSPMMASRVKAGSSLWLPSASVPPMAADSTLILVPTLATATSISALSPNQRGPAHSGCYP